MKLAKLILCVAGCVFAVALLGGCGESEADTAKPTTQDSSKPGPKVAQESAPTTNGGAAAPGGAAPGAGGEGGQPAKASATQVQSENL